MSFANTHLTKLVMQNCNYRKHEIFWDNSILSIRTLPLINVKCNFFHFIKRQQRLWELTRHLNSGWSWYNVICFDDRLISLDGKFYLQQKQQQQQGSYKCKVWEELYLKRNYETFNLLLITSKTCNENFSYISCENLKHGS